MSSSPEAPQQPAASTSPTPVQSLTLNYPGKPVNGEAPSVAWGWLIAAVAIVALPLGWAVIEHHRATGIETIGTMFVAAQLAGICALIAVRVIWIRWWAALVFVVLLAFSLGEFLLLLVTVRSSSFNLSQTVLSPNIAGIFPIVVGLLGFAWVIGLPIVVKRKGAGFIQRRGRAWIIAGIVLGWIAMSASNALVCLADAIFSGSVVARGASPDGKTLAIVRNEGFMDPSFVLYLQRNSIFALTARQVGGGIPTGSRQSVYWTDDSKIVSFWCDGQLGFAYDTRAKKILPVAKTSLYLDSNGKWVSDPVAHALAQDSAYANETLRRAAAAGDLNIMQAMLDHGTKPDPESASVLTSLISAIEAGHVSAAQLLLSRGADPNRKYQEQTPLDRTADRNSAEIATLLLDHGADPNLVSNDWSVKRQTPLMTAAKLGYVKVIQVLLDRGADPTLVNSAGQTALAIATKYRRPAAIAMLNNPTTKPTTKFSASKPKH